MEYKLSSQLLVSCIVLILLTVAVNGLKCVQCGYQPPRAAKMLSMQASIVNDYSPAYEELVQEELDKQTSDPGCPSTLPEATPCDATDVICVKTSHGNQTFRFCYDAPIESHCTRIGYLEECNYACYSDGCNGEEVINRPNANKSGATNVQSLVLFIILLTVNFMKIFEF